MIDLFKTELPDTIEVEGSSYSIHTNFRYWILFYRLSKLKKPLIEFLVMFPFEKPTNLVEAYKKLMEFANPPKELPRPVGENSTTDIVLDFDIDSDYIYAAFIEQYGIDLSNPNLDLHFYKFMALLNSLHDTKINEIMSYRCYEDTKIDFKKQMQNMKTAWRIEYITEEEQKIMDEFNNLFE